MPDNAEQRVKLGWTDDRIAELMRISSERGLRVLETEGSTPERRHYYVQTVDIATIDSGCERFILPKIFLQGPLRMHSLGRSRIIPHFEIDLTKARRIYESLRDDDDTKKDKEPKEAVKEGIFVKHNRVIQSIVNGRHRYSRLLYTSAISHLANIGDGTWKSCRLFTMYRLMTTNPIVQLSCTRIQCPTPTTTRQVWES